MDRQLVYPGQIPYETDILNSNRYAMVGLGMLALDIMGSLPLATGLGCSPTTPASLNVQISPGRFYSLQNVDGSAYSSLAADTGHQILKQGILADAITLPCPAPSTFGFSINYLIQIAYQDNDTDLVVLPYYNSNNPSQAYSGPNNSGTAQATARRGQINISVKAGTAATTGTQTTPAPDSGFTGLWVVTVANGQSTITAGNINMYYAAPFMSGTFTANYSGFSGTVQGGGQWWRLGPIAYLALAPIIGTSNSNTFGISNLPAAIGPATQQFTALPNLSFKDNSASVIGVGQIAARIGPGANLGFTYNNTIAGWTPSGQKGSTVEVTFSWILT